MWIRITEALIFQPEAFSLIANIWSAGSMSVCRCPNITIGSELGIMQMNYGCNSIHQPFWNPYASSWIPQNNFEFEFDSIWAAGADNNVFNLIQNESHSNQLAVNEWISALGPSHSVRQNTMKLWLINAFEHSMEVCVYYGQVKILKKCCLMKLLTPHPHSHQLINAFGRAEVGWRI